MYEGANRKVGEGEVLPEAMDEGHMPVDEPESGGAKV
jgi:hypothetical protein